MHFDPWLNRLPPLNPFLTALRAQKTIQVVNRQNFVLNRQVCELARQNIDLREKIIKMGTTGTKEEKYTSYNNVGYAKEISQRKEINVERERERGLKKDGDKNRKVEDERRKGLDRMYSFGNLKGEGNGYRENKGFRSAQKQHQKQRQNYSYSSHKKYNYLANQFNQDAPQQEYMKQKPDRKSQPLPRPQTEPRFQPRSRPQAQSRPQARPQARTIIESLSQLNRTNPQQNIKPILHIESQPYYQNDQFTSGKKTNKVYLEQSDLDNQRKQIQIQRNRNGSYSPISKLKSIKKVDEGIWQKREEVKEEEEERIQSRKTMGKKQYLTLIGNIFQKSRNQVGKKKEEENEQ